MRYINTLPLPLPLTSILNLGRSVTYLCLFITSMSSLEQRPIEQSLIFLFQSFRKMQGPSYISNFFMPRVTNYYLQGSGINVLQSSYNLILSGTPCFLILLCIILYETVYHHLLNLHTLSSNLDH